MNATTAITAHEAIADLLERYVHTLDDGRVDEWSAFFDEKATYQVTTRENFEAGMPLGIVLCVGRGMMDDRIKALKTANIFESHTHRHVAGRPLVTLREDGNYHVRSSFVVYRTMYTGKTDLFATGVYDDVICADEARLRFLQRRVVLDSRAVDTLMVYPI
jgi:anthranilate 1,2-dioxygenase small subunit